MTTAWYDAPSHTAGAELVARLAQLPSGIPDMDLRAGGLRVRIPSPSGDTARVISAAARELGLTENPAALQTIRFGMAAAEPEPVRSFWEIVLGYDREGPDGLGDPSRRDPRFTVRRLAEPRPLRNRIHVDVVRPSEAVERARAAIGREPSGAFGVMLADDEGNEVDLVPGDALPGTTDWQALFAAMTFYPATSPAEASRLVSAVAELADAAGLPLMIDVRPEGVVFDSGKDQWEDAQGWADARFVALARRIEAVARELGLTADPAKLRFVQFGIDAADVPAIRKFWTAILGYEEDAREQVTDIYEPRRLNPVLFFQQLEEPRRQRNRVRFELAVPEDQLDKRIEAGMEAGGRILAEKPYLVADPEGNEIVIGT